VPFAELKAETKEFFFQKTALPGLATMFQDIKIDRKKYLY
jgi:hypothetical protein